MSPYASSAPSLSSPKDPCVEWGPVQERTPQQAQWDRRRGPMVDPGTEVRLSEQPWEGD